MHVLSSGDHKRASAWVDVQSHTAMDNLLSKDLSHGVGVKARRNWLKLGEI